MFLKVCRTLSGTFTAILGAFIILGSLVLCCVNPSHELIAALLFELGMVIALAIYRFYRSRKKTEKAKELIVKTLESEWPLLLFLRRSAVLLKTVVLFSSMIIVCSEISGMSLAYIGSLDSAKWVYETLPTARFLGMHPAYGLEIMTGAYVAAGNFKKAEPYYPVILSIRRRLYGDRHEYIAGYYADLGDLRVKENRLSEAEALYRHSLDLSHRIFGDTTGGSVLTKLADLLRRENKLDESEARYKDALAMRTHQFGAKSLKVCETLDRYRQLLVAENRLDEAAAVRTREVEILRRESPNSTVSAYFPAAILLVSLLGSYFLFGRKGYLTGLAIRSLQSKSVTKLPDGSAATDDLETLINYRSKEQFKNGDS